MNAERRRSASDRLLGSGLFSQNLSNSISGVTSLPKNTRQLRSTLRAVLMLMNPEPGLPFRSGSK